MMKYKILKFSGEALSSIETALNAHAFNGWEVFHVDLKAPLSNSGYITSFIYHLRRNDSI